MPPTSRVVNVPKAARSGGAIHLDWPPPRSDGRYGHRPRPSEGPPRGPEGYEESAHRPSARLRGWDTSTPSELFLVVKHQGNKDNDGSIETTKICNILQQCG